MSASDDQVVGRPAWRAQLARWTDAPLPFVVWAAALVAIAAWVQVRVYRAGLTLIDRPQQFYLVQAMGHLNLKNAMVGSFSQASPPGYGFVALPTYLLFRHDHGGGLRGEYWAYDLGGWVAMALLGLAAIAAIRATGRARRSLHELIGVAVIVGASSTLACLTESFHPGDLAAMAGVLAGFAAVTRKQYRWAIVALGAGLLMKQWVVIPIAVIAALHTGRQRLWLAAGPVLVAAVVTAPFFIANPSATFQAVTAAIVVPGSRTLVGHLLRHVSNKNLVALEARLLPLALVGGLCLWIDRRKITFTVEVAIAALAAAFMIRPVVDPAGFTYYLAPGFSFMALLGRRSAWPASVLAAAFLLVRFDGNPHARVPLPTASLDTALTLGCLLACLLALRTSTTNAAGT